MIRKVTLALVASLVSMTLLAQTGGVKGTVLNRVDRTPVTNAELTLFQGAQEIATAKISSPVRTAQKPSPKIHVN